MNMRDPQDEIRADSARYSVVQLQRTGNKFTMLVAGKEGAPFVVVGEHEMENLGNEVLAGIFICSHDPDVKEAATVDDVIIKH